jgi:hypothetical protein
MESCQRFGGEQGCGAQPLDDAAGFQNGIYGQRPGGYQLVGLQVPDHGAVGANNGAGVPQLVL